MIIRAEAPDDREAIHAVTSGAFGRPAEARLIAALRDSNQVILSLVAFCDGQLVGHILFFPLVIKSERETHAAVGLGPMAVCPEFQKRGIGSALVHAGLDELRKQNHAAVIVLGHPEFYRRFGFVPASTYGITSRYDVPDEVFMAVELVPDGLAGKGGTVVYAAEFDEV